MEFYALALTLLIMFGACLSIDRHIKVEKKIEPKLIDPMLDTRSWAEKRAFSR